MSRLVEEIVSNREWRIRELEQLKRLKVTVLYTLSDKIKLQYFRMCIPYIYAHWEGFVVETFKLMINFINDQNLEQIKVKKELLTFSHANTYKPLSGKQRFDQQCQFTNKFIQKLTQPLYIDVSLFTTKSNLNYEQLDQIFSWFCMDISKCSEYKECINRLVNQRNRIAHGENGITIEYRNIEEYIKTMQEVFDIIILLIETYISNEQYLHQESL